MPDVTSTFGITTPCETEPITMAAINGYTLGVESALSSTWTTAGLALRSPAAAVYQNNPLTLTAGVSATVAFDTEYFDRGGFWSAGSPTIVTIPQNGSYQVTAYLGRNANFGNFLMTRIAVLVAGVEMVYSSLEQPLLSGVGSGVSMVGFLPSCLAGQQVTMTAIYIGTATATVQCALSIALISTV